MKLSGISINNLRRRKARMAFVTIGLLVGIATIVTLITLTRSMSTDIERKMDEFGANILITPRSNDLSMSYGGISLGRVSFDEQEIREEDLAAIHAIANSKNISAVAPKVLGGVKVQGKNLLVVGADFDKELRMKQWWQVFGSVPKGADELLVGSDAADVLHVMQGDSLEIGGKSYRISGVLDRTGSQDDALVFLTLKEAQRLLGKEGKISLVEVAALCSGCPISDMVNQIAEKLPNARVSAIRQVVESRIHALDQFRRFSYGVAAVVLFIGSLIVFVTMMGSVNERTTEIGVFRAIGFRKKHIMRIILLEALIVSLFAGVAGYAVGMGAARLALPFMAESGKAALAWDPSIAVGSVALAVVLGLLATLYPAVQASRKDPTEALRSL